VFGAAVGPDGGASPALIARCHAAAALARRHPDARLLVTGGVGRFGEAESRLMRAALESEGIASERIVEEPTARDTVENVLAAAALLRGRAGRVLAVSHGYHLPRCVLLLRLAGLQASVGASVRGSGGRLFARLWQHLRELPALPWDVVQVLLRRS
jgi:uncharacterized SAM-binding protein YcdF (DUF218 family)